MKLKVSVLGLVLVTICSFAWGKSDKEIVEEAKSKSSVCQANIEFDRSEKAAGRELINPKYKRTEKIGADGKPYDYLEEVQVSDEQNAAYRAQFDAHKKRVRACEADLINYLPPAIFKDRQAFQKEMLAERVAAGSMNPDGTLREPPFYKNWFSWHGFKRDSMQFIEGFGKLLLWPLIVVVLLGGFLLITQPKEFARLVGIILQGVISLLYKKKN